MNEKIKKYSAQVETQDNKKRGFKGSFIPKFSPSVFPENNCVDFESPPVESMMPKYKRIMWETYDGILTQQEIDTTIDEAIKSLEEDSIG